MKPRISARDREIIKNMKFLRELQLMKDLGLFIRIKK